VPRRSPRRAKRPSAMSCLNTSRASSEVICAHISKRNIGDPARAPRPSRPRARPNVSKTSSSEGRPPSPSVDGTPSAASIENDFGDLARRPRPPPWGIHCLPPPHVHQCPPEPQRMWSQQRFGATDRRGASNATNGVRRSSRLLTSRISLMRSDASSRPNPAHELPHHCSRQASVGRQLRAFHDAY